MRLIAFDAGTKRIGIAVSDAGCSIASPLKYLENNSRLMPEISKLIEIYDPEKLVVGNPLNMDGTPSKGLFVPEFVAALEKIKGRAQIVMWDERLTTYDAEQMLIGADMSRAKRKKVIDKLAAALMLQSYINQLQKGR
ncbi:MAG: Holliday junction resolvase RuvX [bacterium]